MTTANDRLAAITAERDHWERRYERLVTLHQAGRRDPIEWVRDEEYADGVRFGLDLALMRLAEPTS